MRQIPPAGTGMDAITPQAMASPIPLASWNHHHLGRAGEPARLAFGHMAEDGQDKNAEYHQDVQGRVKS
ncbi:MAG TPA: hypothetical protein ENK56_06710 [Chloroflexi bacterium]|nr:hypothetical protein [Chloroflexota bacterium]